MSREDLIELGRKIVQAEEDEAELDRLLEVFDQNVPHPNGSNLFFYPADYNARVDHISSYKPTVEEVVDQCLAYQPIQL